MLESPRLAPRTRPGHGPANGPQNGTGAEAESRHAAGARQAETDHASVPKKPTADMLAEGAQAGGVSVEVAWRIYRAMLRATDPDLDGDSQVTSR